MSHPKTNTKNVLKNPSSNSQSKTTGKITNEKEESGRPPVEYRFNEPDSPQTIQYEEGTNKIKLATFSKLIEHVTSPKLNGNIFSVFQRNEVHQIRKNETLFSFRLHVAQRNHVNLSFFCHFKRTFYWSYRAVTTSLIQKQLIHLPIIVCFYF